MNILFDNISKIGSHQISNDDCTDDESSLIDFNLNLEFIDKVDGILKISLRVSG